MEFHGNRAAIIRMIDASVITESYGAQQLTEIFRDQFLAQHEKPIHEAMIDRRSDNQYVAYLRHALEYSYEAVAFNLENDQIQNVIRNYVEEEPVSPARYEMPSELANIDYWDYEFFVGTPCEDLESAKEMVDKVYAYAISFGFKTYRAVGRDASIVVYQKFLRSKLKGFVSVGHGNKQGLLLSDGHLGYSWFDVLPQFALIPQVITLNSCEVFNDPLKSSILKHHARTFIGGVTTLKVAISEDVTAGFWRTELDTPSSPMGTTIKKQSDLYPRAGTFGIGGDTGPFLPV